MYHFLVSDYYATGEGRTICLLITRAYPMVDEYDKDPDVIAEEEFTKRFGEFLSMGVEAVNQEEFMKRFGHYLPEYLKKLLENEDQPGNLNYMSQFHLNYS